MRLTVLCENSVATVRPYGLLGEHGFACHLETSQGNFLFDTGGGLTIGNNAEKLGIDLSRLRGIILSHGHRDHSGGLRQVLEQSAEIPVYAHPELFSAHFSRNSGQLTDIGIPWSQYELENLGARFRFSVEPLRISPQLLLSGEIPRHSTLESGDPNLLTRSAEDERLVTDPLSDDLSLFIETERGLVVLLGCAHAGLPNILDHARRVTGEERIHMVLGGTHLQFCSETQIVTSIERLQQLAVERIGVSHCTGFDGTQMLVANFGQRCFPASVGVQVEI